VIAIVNYGVGNLKSISKAVEKFDRVVVTSDVGDIESADGVILPGVGAFCSAMNNLGELKDVIVNLKVPVLGICLGMQLLAEVSEEGGIYEGLGIVKGRVVKFPKHVGKIPHMGWNVVKNEDHALFEGIKDEYFYFVHSYYFKTSEGVIATTEYGIEFPSAVAKDNFMGVQFHPEKSGKVGLNLIENFVELCKQNP